MARPRVTTLIRSRRRRPSLLAAAALALTVVAAAVWATMPRVDHLREGRPGTTAFMAARQARGPRAWTALAALPAPLVCAVVKAEDREFFRHGALDFAQLARAVIRNARGEARVGASTLTQQLARNLFLGEERTLVRKLREAIVARRLEATLPKRRILEIYLNVVEWGHGVWGVTEAARHYVGREPTALGTFESVALASLLAAPRAPLAGPNRARAARVQQRVVGQLVRAGVLSLPDARAALARLAALDARLRAGQPLRAALGELAPPPDAAPPFDPDATRAVLADGCGLARELAAAARGGAS